MEMTLKYPAVDKVLMRNITMHILILFIKNLL